MVTKFGMSQEIGFMGFSEDEYKKSYSDYTQDVIIILKMFDAFFYII